MLNGIKTYVDGDFCVNCDMKVNVEVHNFCPKCGSALNSNAIKFKEQQNKKIKIELLDELSNAITDENSLKIILEKIKSL